MLNAVGIITEYDPFHNGHVYQLKKAREETGADVTVVVMSSNWTQRGEPAIFDKWTRAQMALENGADLVFELPIQDAVEPASIFAEKAVNLVDAIQCDYLSFGSEHANRDFMKIADTDIPSLNEFENPTKSFPELFRDAIMEKQGIDLSEPNDTLGFWYARANHKLGSHLKLVPILRNQSNHNDDDFKKTIASGKAIRNAIHDHSKGFENYLPDSFAEFKNEKPLFWEDFWPYLKYEINQTSAQNLGKIYQMNEGLENRFKSKAIEANSFQEFLESIKSKRYTYTRLQRLAVYTLFEITKDDIKKSPDALRVLGMNEIGKKYLNQIKKETRLPIIDRIGKNEFENTLKLECKSGLLEEMVNDKKQDLYRHPIIL